MPQGQTSTPNTAVDVLEREMAMIKNLKITSAAQALQQSKQLKSVWSLEGLLTQRILIYAVELLEKIAANKSAKKRPRTAWQAFLAKEMRTGSSIQLAAAKWRALKNPKP